MIRTASYDIPYRRISNISAISALTDDFEEEEELISAVTIQRVIRGGISRKKLKIQLKNDYKRKYLSQFDTTENVIRYRFKSNGAAFIIQQWIRKQKSFRKALWHRKYWRFIEALKREKILRRALRKNGGYRYSRATLEDKDIHREATVIVIQRVVRGFLGRRRFFRLKQEHDAYMKYCNENALIVQQYARMFIARCKYPLVGRRFRMLRRKRIRWEMQLLKDALATHHVHDDDDDSVSQQSEEEKSGVDSNNESHNNDITYIDVPDNSHVDQSASRPGTAVTASDYRGSKRGSVKALRFAEQRKNKSSFFASARRFLTNTSSTGFGTAMTRGVSGLNLLTPPRTPMFRHTIRRHFMERRPSFLFLNLRLGDLHRLTKVLPASALVIQCCWRRYQANIIVQRIKDKRRQQHFAKIIIWMRCFLWRRRVAKSVGKIQPKVKERARVRALKKKSAIIIQRRWQTYKQRVWLLQLLSLRQTSMLKLNRWSNRIIAHRIRRMTISRQRTLLENFDGGKLLYEQTTLRWHMHYLWLGIKKRNYEAQHEVQRIFALSCLNGGLDVARTIKIVKDCPGLLAEDFSLNDVEIQFTKVKSGTEKRIDYPRFLDLLVNFAIIKFIGADPGRVLANSEAKHQAASTAAYMTAIGSAATGVSSAVDATATKSRRGSVNASLWRSRSNDSSLGDDGVKNKVAEDMEEFHFAGATGRIALICKFVHVYFGAMYEYKRNEEYLGAKSARSISLDLIIEAISKIQQFRRNRVYIAQCTKELAQFKSRKVAARTYHAASRIQSLIRSFLGRVSIRKLAQAMYSKFIDGETETEYWFNPRTKKSYWTKPTLLGQFDCGLATRLPKDDERYTVMCSNCDVVTATCFCIHCEEPYCTVCFATNHRTGKRKDHEHLIIDSCSQCDFQTGTIFCTSCNDNYCDSCYKHLHKMGRLRFHVSKRVCNVCEVCDDRSAQWQELTNVEENTSTRSRSITAKVNKLWCNPCYKAEYGSYPSDVAADVALERQLKRFPYYGRSEKIHREAIREAKRRIEIESAFERRQQELRQMKETKAAGFIQRVYRGYIVRCDIRDFLQQRRDFLKLREKEMVIRRRLWYRLAAVYGLAPRLKSDTPLERVMNMYPQYMHQILAMSVEDNWKYACQLLIEHEHHMEFAAPKSNMMQRFMAKRRLKSTQKIFDRAVVKCDLLEKQLIDATTRYENGKESGALLPSRMEALELVVQNAKQQLDTSVQKRDQIQSELENADNDVYNLIGPRGLQLLVEDRRKYGLPLPFRISIKRHSRLALVHWIDDEEDEEWGAYATGADDHDFPRLGRRQPGEWKKYLMVSDFVFIGDNTYRVCVPMVAKKKRSSTTTGRSSRPSSAKSESGKSRPESAKSGRSDVSGSSKRSDEDDVDEKLNSSKKSLGANAVPAEPKTLLQQRSVSGIDDELVGGMGALSSESYDPDSGVDVGGESARTVLTQTTGLEKELREECTEDHITLDRPWMLPDLYDADISKVLPRIFYYQPFFFMRRKLLQTYFAQKFIAVTAITMHKWASLMEALSGQFDEESDSAAAMLRRAETARRSRDRWLLSSRSIVQMSYDFTLRRRMGRVFGAVSRTTVAAARLGSNVLGVMHSRAKETPYEYWKRSIDKVDLHVTIDTGGESRKDLGDIKIDTKAPVEILREFIRRSFREELNTSFGDSFLFMRLNEESGNEEILNRKDEFRTYSSDFCASKLDPKTFLSVLTVIIVPDPERGRVFIEEYEEDDGEDSVEAELKGLL